MCKCVLTWVEDEEVTGAHSAVAVQCDKYIAALENELIRRGADSSELEGIKKACGGLV